MSNSLEIGTLVVVVLKARNLHDKHSFYKQDVYAQVTLNGTTKSTHADVKGGQHPIWDAELRFPVLKDANAKHRKLEVVCLAKEPRSDDLLGKGVVNIAETIRSGEFDEWVTLDVNGVSRGEVYLEMTYFASSPAPAGLSVPSTLLNRRPSKLSSSERLSRLPQSLTPSKPPLQETMVPQSENIKGSHLHALTPPPSRFPFFAPPKKFDALSPFPENTPTNLPDTGSPSSSRRQNNAPSQPNDVPSVLRPGNARPNTTASHPNPYDTIYQSTAPNAFLNVGTVYEADSSSTPHRYDDVLSGSRPHLGLPPILAPSAGSHLLPLGAPAISVGMSGSTSGILAFPSPEVAPVSESDSDGVPYNRPRQDASYQEAKNDAMDPYSKTRYQTLLPLPSGSTQVVRAQQPLTSKDNSEASLLKALRSEEEEALRRIEQEQKDLELAMQLDRQLNIGNE